MDEEPYRWNDGSLETDDPVLSVLLDYPSDDRPQWVQVGADHTRVVGRIRVRFDFGRDGWVIEADAAASEADEDFHRWEEVALIPNPAS